MIKRLIHISSLIIYTTIILSAVVYLTYVGRQYYKLPLEERFYSPLHDSLKPNGIMGHGLGIIGTLLILFGVTIYIAAKRHNFLLKFIRLKYILEFHIFLCILGPVLILYHTAFKFGGIISIAFWSMIIVVLSGVVGRFIYIQIPRTIEGRELSMNELKEMKADLVLILHERFMLEREVAMHIVRFTGTENNDGNKISIRKLRKLLRDNKIPSDKRRSILKIIKHEISLTGKIARLHKMQKLFKYWHVAHMPFALIMLIIVVIHVVIALVFGYKWVF